MADALPSAPPPRSPGHRESDIHDDEYESTQPLSLPSSLPSPGSPPRSPDHRESDIHDEPTQPLSVSSPGEANQSTASSVSYDDRHCRISLSVWARVVTWKDHSHQEHHTSHLRFDLNVDTSERQAMFALQGFIHLQDRNFKSNLFLLIHPERIQSIVCTNPPVLLMQEAPTVNFISLHFTMTQPPSLVTAKDRPLEPKPQYQGVLDTMKSLGTVREFTIHLNRLDLLPEIQEQLGLLPSVFSPAQPFGILRTDEMRASFDTLFHGRPGQVIDLGKTASPGTNHNQTLAEIVEETAAEPTGVIPVPPPYPNGGSSPNAPGYSTPNDRKRRRSESLSPSTTDRYHGAGEPGSSLIRTTENERSGERVQPPSTSGALLQSPNQFSTPTDRKRRRTSELLSRSPTDKDILHVIRRVLDRTASLDARVKELEKLITECLDAEDKRTTHSEQEDQIHGQIQATVDERIDDHMWEVQRELEDALFGQTQEWVTEAVELAQDELQEDLDYWVNDIMEQMEKTVKKEVKREVKMENMGKRKVLKDVVQAVTLAVKMIKRARAYEEIVKSTTRRRMSTSTASTQSTATSTKSTKARAYKEDVKSTTRRRMSTSTASTQSTAASTKPILTKPILTKPSPSLHRTFHTAIHDIQKRYSGKFSAEEMMRVLDHLEANLIEAVKYNGCGAELKWLYVQRWAAKPE